MLADNFDRVADFLVTAQGEVMRKKRGVRVRISPKNRAITQPLGGGPSGVSLVFSMISLLVGLMYALIVNYIV